MVMLPEVGSGVWIEFEAGQLDNPIWSGAWWASGQRPDPQGAGVRVIVSEKGHKVILDDDADEVKLVHGGGPEIKMTAHRDRADLRRLRDQDQQRRTSRSTTG